MNTGDGEGKMVTVENVKKYYVGSKALDGLSLSIEKGEFVFLIGKSGAGKTTLMNLLMKDQEPDEGSITVNGVKLAQLKSRHLYRYRRFLGIVFQDFRLMEDWNVYENVAFAQRVIEVSPSRIPGRVKEVLALVGLSGKERKYPRELSGGEKQRVAIARAIINQPFILLADEPTRNLDRRNSIEVMKLFEKINQSGTTVLVVTHNREVVNALGKRVVTMEDGRIVNDCNPGRYYYGI